MHKKRPLTLRRWLITILLVVSAVGSAAAGENSPDPGNEPRWTYRSAGSTSFLGAEPGEFLEVRRTEPGAYRYSFHQLPDPDAGVKETWRNRTLVFVRTELHEQREEKIVHLDGGIHSTWANVTFEPPVPLRAPADWSVDVSEHVATMEHDEEGRVTQGSSDRVLRHILFHDSGNTQWHRGTSVREFQWGQEWVDWENEGESRIELWRPTAGSDPSPVVPASQEPESPSPAADSDDRSRESPAGAEPASALDERFPPFSAEPGARGGSSGEPDSTPGQGWTLLAAGLLGVVAVALLLSLRTRNK